MGWLPTSLCLARLVCLAAAATALAHPAVPLYFAAGAAWRALLPAVGWLLLSVVFLPPGVKAVAGAVAAAAGQLSAGPRSAAGRFDLQKIGPDLQKAMLDLQGAAKSGPTQPLAAAAAADLAFLALMLPEQLLPLVVRVVVGVAMAAGLGLSMASPQLKARLDAHKV